MKHVSLDQEDERIKRFVQSLPIDPDGSVLEINGKAVARVLPVSDQTVDDTKLRAAIRKRRAQSRVLNEEWEAADREVWEQTQEDQE